MNLTDEPKGICVRQRRVLEDVGEWGDGCFVVYGRTEEDDPREGTEYMMTKDDWRDLGKPEQITVTIEAGNILEEQQALGIDENSIGKFGADAPETSRKAAINIKKESGTKRRRVYDYIVGCGSIGATDEEIQRGANVVPNTERPRRKELEENGDVVDSGRTRPGISGEDMIVWVVAGE